MGGSSTSWSSSSGRREGERKPELGPWQAVAGLVAGQGVELEAPPCCSTTVRHRLRPSPRPSARVVKNGVKSCCATSGGTPRPRSRTQNSARRGSGTRTASVSSRAAGGVSASIARRPLRARLRITCSIIVRSQTTRGAGAPGRRSAPAPLLRACSRTSGSTASISAPASTASRARFAPAHEVVHASDHAPGPLGLLRDALGRLEQHVPRPAFRRLVQQVQRTGGEAGDRGERLVELVAEQRGHLAHRRQARRGLQFSPAAGAPAPRRGAAPSGRGRRSSSRCAPAPSTSGASKISTGKRSPPRRMNSVSKPGARPSRERGSGPSAAPGAAGTRRHARAASTAASRCRASALGREADEFAEGRVDVGDAPPAGRARSPVTSESSIAWRKASASATAASARLRRRTSRASSATTPANASESPSTSAIARLGDQTWAPGVAVQPHLQRRSRQFDDALGDVGSAATQVAGVREPRAVASTNDSSW